MPDLSFLRILRILRVSYHDTRPRAIRARTGSSRLEPFHPIILLNLHLAQALTHGHLRLLHDR